MGAPTACVATSSTSPSSSSSGTGAASGGGGGISWETLGPIRVPCIVRDNDEGSPYCAARFLGPAVRCRVRPEVFACATVGALRATAHEARLLEISAPECGGKPFEPGEPLMRLDDARELLSFLKRCHARLAGRPGPCGFLTLADRTVPYVLVDRVRYVPLESLPDPKRLMSLPTRDIDGWNLSYLKFLHTVMSGKGQAIRCSGVSIDDVKRLTGLEFVEYWPRHIFKEDDYEGEELENHIDRESVEVKLESPNNDTFNNHYAMSSDYSTNSQYRDTAHILYENMSDSNATTTTTTDNHVNHHRAPPLSIPSYPLVMPTMRRRQYKPLDDERDERRAQKLEKMRARRAQMLANETPEQRARRLLRMRIRQQERIANETPEQRELRLMKLRVYQARRIQNETDEQRQKRLLQLRQNQSRRLAKKRNEILVRKLRLVAELEQAKSATVMKDQADLGSKPEVVATASPHVQHASSAFEAVQYASANSGYQFPAASSASASIGGTEEFHNHAGMRY